ncbi:hypothetical protein [Methylobacterium sp. Leaf104]|uniref:hypothetical protein n=1 Tax=Methylobacterium sp. Leaf104 TaxID=1736254 RepID=UPI00138EF8FC|nr:hypothetical protein [Methylobacterium sp. Leaf104]MCI9878878.1 hypothetical protein [Methylobacterium goesingense]
MGVRIKNDDDAGRKGTLKAIELSDVLWAAWSDDGRTPRIRVIRGRNLTGKHLRHGVLLVENETSALQIAESHGDAIPTMADGRTLDVPEPAVPQTLIDAVMSDLVLLFDGIEMDFYPDLEA